MCTRYGKSRRPRRCRCPEACGGPYRMGVNGAHNTVEGNVGAYNTVYVRVVMEYCFVQGMVPGTVVLTCEPCLAILRTSHCPYRAGVPGRLISVGSDRASRRRTVSRGWAYSRSESAGSESEVVFGLGLPIGEAVRRRLESEVSALVGEVGRSSRRVGVVPLRPVLSVGDWNAPSACCFRFLGRPMSCMLSTWAKPWRGSRSPRDSGFMNPT